MNIESSRGHESSEPSRYSSIDHCDRRDIWVKRLVLLSLALLVIFVVVDSLTERHVEQASESFFQWVEQHPFSGVLAVVLVYALATICFVPGSILTIGTGFAFRSAFESFGKGLALASTSVFLGATIGSIGSFLLGRYLFRTWVMQLAASYPVFRAVDRALERNGLKIMVLLRLSPLIPYNALDYISGVTSISLASYSFALLGILPGTIMFCAIGATASSLADGTDEASSGNLRLFALFFGLVFAFAGVAVASYYSKIELDRILSEDASGENEVDSLARSATNEAEEIV
jgi:uncharacterized membrane protein YdjX (TVP38/TMEM64 family)